jgi:hypothetical protein
MSIDSSLSTTNCLLVCSRVISTNICGQNLSELMMMSMFWAIMSSNSYCFVAVITCIHLPQLVQISLFIFLRKQSVNYLWRHLVDKPLS